MGKVKNSAEKKKETPSVEKSNAGKDSAESTEKKKARRRTAAKSKFATPIKRLCKSLKIPTTNRDAVHILDDAIQKYLSGLTKHMSTMLANSNKKLTQKTAKLAFVAFMESLGANDEITRGALKRADSALKHLEESFGAPTAATPAEGEKPAAAAPKKKKKAAATKK